MSDLSNEMFGLLDDEIVNRFKRAIEIGKWPDGRALTKEQRNTCMQAIILYEHNTMPENERTGYVPPKKTPCGPQDDTKPIKWQ